MSNKPNSPKVGYTVSDLHLFARRSSAERHMETIASAAAQADVFVFNGDTFDFRWTTLPSIEHTVDAAINWLGEFTRGFPKCRFHFVLGNHDSLKPFVTGLSHLVKDTPNLEWHPYYLRLNRSVFLHGDVSIGRPHHRHLERYRSRWMHDKKRGNVHNFLYDMAVNARLHKAVHLLACPKRRLAENLLTYLEGVEDGLLEGVEAVYFGHTHVAMSDFEHRGLRFHNSGAPMKGMKFNLLRADV